MEKSFEEEGVSLARKKAAAKQTTIAKKKSTVATTPIVRTFDRVHVCVGFEFLISNNTYIRVLILRLLSSLFFLFFHHPFFLCFVEETTQINNTYTAFHCDPS